jgi:hypothetical protein
MAYYLTIKTDCTCYGPENSRQQAKQRGFSRAVGTLNDVDAFVKGTGNSKQRIIIVAVIRLFFKAIFQLV